MKSVFEISDVIEVPYKRRRIDTVKQSSVISAFVMSTSEEGDKSSEVPQRGSMSPESCSEGEDGKSKVFSCSMCSYRTDRKNNLKRHTLTMHELSQALLECCNLRFLNKAELRMHTQKYHADGYYCEVCDRNFCRKALLKRHFSVHSGYKEFSCHFCGYETSHKSNLERHMRVHRKTSMPTAGTLSHGGFLPKLPTTCASHLPPSVAFRASLMSSQSHPILPSTQSHPTVFPLVVGQHPHLHPPLGSSWPVLHHPPLVPGRPLALPMSDDSLGENPFLKAQQPVKSLTATDDLKEDASSTSIAPKKKKGGPRRDFSVSALLGEDFPIGEPEETEGGNSATISSTHLQYNTLKDSHADLGLPKSSLASSINHTPAKIQRPTPIHPRPFPYSSAMTYASSYIAGSLQTPTYPQPTLSIPRNSQVMEKGSQGSSSVPSPTNAPSLPAVPQPSRAFASFHAPAVPPESERPAEEDIHLSLSTSRLCNQALDATSTSKLPGSRMGDSGPSQNYFVEASITMPTIGSLGVTLSPPTNQLQRIWVFPFLLILILFILPCMPLSDLTPRRTTFTIPVLRLGTGHRVWKTLRDLKGKALPMVQESRLYKKNTRTSQASRPSPAFFAKGKRAGKNERLTSAPNLWRLIKKSISRKSYGPPRNFRPPSDTKHVTVLLLLLSRVTRTAFP
ncbi:zinc finger protein PLAG1-like [Macrobrachium rosenbergii]|uniref:zinc finger protein PLAG1-like n=1 Tax=Macrobrachium rosenbergii TaxID=79674 RepID=UPI0034D4241A